MQKKQIYDLRLFMVWLLLGGEDNVDIVFIVPAFPSVLYPFLLLVCVVQKNAKSLFLAVARPESHKNCKFTQNFFR